MTLYTQTNSFFNKHKTPFIFLIYKSNISQAQHLVHYRSLLSGKLILNNFDNISKHRGKRTYRPPQVFKYMCIYASTELSQKRVSQSKTLSQNSAAEPV